MLYDKDSFDVVLNGLLMMQKRLSVTSGLVLYLFP